MKFLPVIGLGLLFLFGAPASADEATERRLGDDAFASGDYENAARFYSSARVLAGGNLREWGADTLALARTRLHAGDLEEARRLLEEFRSKLPAESAGLLPGQLLLAERRYPEAESFFRSLRKSASDPATVGAARLALAFTRLRKGDPAGAAGEYAAIETENADLPAVARDARLGRIYALLQAGRQEEARQLFEERRFADEAPREYVQLEAAAALKRKDLKAFLSSWETLEKNPRRYPDALMFDLASEGADLAAGAGDSAFAGRLLNTAFELAGNDQERQNILRRLINLQAKSDPVRAAATLERYLDFFPDAPDRTSLLMQGARLLAGAGRNPEAIALFARITGDNRIPVRFRLEAAQEAAELARRSGDAATELRMLRYLVEQAETPAQRQRGNYLLGEHYFREKNYAKAEEFFRKVEKEGGEQSEAARYWLLHSLFHLKRYKDALPVATQLHDSKNPEYAAEADYYRALLLEKNGELAAARSEYQKFIMLHPKSARVPAATYSAADLAYRQREFAAAAGGFRRYAELAPKAEDAPVALYRAVQAAYFGGMAGEMALALSALDNGYPDSPGAVEARLQIAGSLLRDGRPDEAEKMIQLLASSRRAADPEVAAELLYLRAGLAVAREKPEEALKLYREILDRYVTSGFGADAAFAAGGLLADSGDYAEALKFYRRAKELRPSGVFGDACSGRIADCRYSLYSETLDPADLAAAVDLYRKLSEKAGDGRIRLQSLYKLGKSLELSGESGAALAAYDRLLYLARDQRRSGISPDPVWTGKAAYAACLAYLKEGSPQGAASALRAMAMLKELNLPVGEEFDRIREEIKRKHNLQEKQ